MRAKPPHPQIFRQERPAWRLGPDTPVPSALAAGSRRGPAVALT